MLHLGDSSNDIWHSWYDGNRWTENVRIPGQTSKAPPGLGAYDGRLHMVHLGNSSNSMWHSTFDGSSWSPNVRIARHSSRAAPALADYFGLNMVHIGDESNTIWWSVYANGQWSEDRKLPGLTNEQRSKATPALAATPNLPAGNLRSRLNMVHLRASRLS